MKSSKFVLNLVRIGFNTLVVVALCAVLVMVGKTAHDFGYRIFSETAMASREDAEVIYMQITEEMSLKDIAERAEQLGLTDSSTIFLIQLHLSDYRNSIDPGIYTVNTGMTPTEIITCLATQDPLVLKQEEDQTESKDEDDSSEENQGEEE